MNADADVALPSPLKAVNDFRRSQIIRFLQMRRACQPPSGGGTTVTVHYMEFGEGGVGGGCR